MKGKCSGAFLSTFPPLLGWVGFPFYFLTHRLPAAWPICMGMVKKMLNYCDFTPRARKEGSEKGACDAFLGGYTRGGFRKAYLSFLAFFYVPFFYFTNIFNFPV